MTIEFVHEVGMTDPTDPLIAGVRLNGEVPPWPIVGRPRLEPYPDPEIGWLAPILWVKFRPSHVEVRQDAGQPHAMVVMDAQRVPWAYAHPSMLMPNISQDDEDKHLEITAHYARPRRSAVLTVDMPLICGPEAGSSDNEWANRFIAATWPLTEAGSQGDLPPFVPPATPITCGQSWLMHLPPEILANELIRRVVIEHGRQEAITRGYTGRVRFFRAEPTGRQFIENKPGSVFMEVQR